MSVRGLVTKSSLTLTSPDVFSINPATRRNKVDLPQPLGPTSEINSPARISKLAPSSAVTVSPKTFVTFFPSITV